MLLPDCNGVTIVFIGYPFLLSNVYIRRCVDNTTNWDALGLC